MSSPQTFVHLLYVTGKQQRGYGYRDVLCHEEPEYAGSVEGLISASSDHLTAYAETSGATKKYYKYHIPTANQRFQQICHVVV